jgi:hypothetical protein
MKVDDERFAFACQRLAHTKRLDPNLKANPRAPARFTINRIGGHPPPTHPNGIHTVARATVTSLPHFVCDFKHNERYGDVSPASRNGVLLLGKIEKAGELFPSLH